MYDESIKVYRDYLATLAYAEQKGHKEGRQEGKHEEAMNIAREMKKADVPVEQITRFTKLSIEEIEKL